MWAGSIHQNLQLRENTVIQACSGVFLPPHTFIYSFWSYMFCFVLLQFRTVFLRDLLCSSVCVLALVCLLCAFSLNLFFCCLFYSGLFGFIGAYLLCNDKKYGVWILLDKGQMMCPWRSWERGTHIPNIWYIKYLFSIKIKIILKRTAWSCLIYQLQNSENDT